MQPIAPDRIVAFLLRSGGPILLTGAIMLMAIGDDPTIVVWLAVVFFALQSLLHRYC